MCKVKTKNCNLQFSFSIRKSKNALESVIHTSKAMTMALFKTYTSLCKYDPNAMNGHASSFIIILLQHSPLDNSCFQQFAVKKAAQGDSCYWQILQCQHLIPALKAWPALTYCIHYSTPDCHLVFWA